MWYDVNKTLTHNCLFNFLYGNRGSGKTYGVLKHCVNRYVKKKQQFIYLRRTLSELENIDMIFNSLIKDNVFGDSEIKVKGNEFFINGEVMGYACALSVQSSFKSIPFNDVFTIIFEEFLIDENDQYKRYLKSEVTKFKEFYETVCRLRLDENGELDPSLEPVVFFLGNAFSTVNPYFLEYNLNMPYGSKIYKNNDCLLELVQNEVFIEMKKKTRFGRMNSGSHYERYAVLNQSMNETKDFIRKRTGIYDYVMTVVYKGYSLGVWRSVSQGLVSISTDIDSNNPLTYSISTDDHNENTVLIKGAKRCNTFKLVIEHYKLGKIICDNNLVKTLTLDMLRQILY